MKTSQRSDRQKGVIALVFLALIYSGVGLFARFLNGHFLLFQQVYLRVLAALIVGVIVFWKDLDFSKFKKISSKEWLLLCLRAASLYLFGVVLYTAAVNSTKYSNVAFIGSVPTTAILGFILLREKITWKKIILILLAFVGAIIIGVNNFSNIFSWSRGDFLALLLTFFFSLGYVSRKWHSSLLNNKEISLIIFALAFVMIFGISVAKGDGLPISSWGIIVFLVVVAAGIANIANMFLTNYGFEKVEAVLASNILTLESAFAVVLGFAFYREIPDLKEIIGGILIIASVLLMNRVESGKSN